MKIKWNINYILIFFTSDDSLHCLILNHNQYYNICLMIHMNKTYLYRTHTQVGEQMPVEI